jgi:hypothetical protein
MKAVTAFLSNLSGIANPPRPSGVIIYVGTSVIPKRAGRPLSDNPSRFGVSKRQVNAAVAWARLEPRRAGIAADILQRFPVKYVNRYGS